MGQGCSTGIQRPPVAKIPSQQRYRRRIRINHSLHFFASVSICIALCTTPVNTASVYCIQRASQIDYWRLLHGSAEDKCGKCENMTCCKVSRVDRENYSDQLRQDCKDRYDDCGSGVMQHSDIVSNLQFPQKRMTQWFFYYLMTQFYWMEPSNYDNKWSVILYISNSHLFTAASALEVFFWGAADSTF